MPKNGEVRFHTPSIFAGQTGVIDKANYVIRGVSVITGNQEAEGHNLYVDATTLEQLQSCAKSRGKIPVNLDHGTGVKDLNGYLTTFRLDGDKLRADWHLLTTHDESDKMMERAEVMPECFGLSVAFKGPPKGVPTGGGRMAARCEKLQSVDCVTRPAANDGLFSAKEVDKDKKGMALENDTKTTEPTIADLLKAITDLTGRLDKQDEFNQQVIEQFNGSQEPTLEDLHQATDEQLAELGITRAEVDAAVAEATAGTEDGAKGAEGDAAKAGDGAVATAGAASGGDVSAPATFKALNDRVIALEKRNADLEMAAKKDAETVELKAIETKVTTLAKQRDDAVKLSEIQKSKIQALELYVKTGTRPAKPGFDNGMRVFSTNGEGELHRFQVRVKALKDEGKTEAEAIRFAQKEDPQAHADWVTSLARK